MSSSKNKVLLDAESLKRHFDTVDPDYRKLFLFYISNKYNEFKNTSGELKKQNKIQTAIKDFRTFLNEKYNEITNKPTSERELIIRVTTDAKMMPGDTNDESTNADESDIKEGLEDLDLDIYEGQETVAGRSPMNTVSSDGNIILGVIPKSSQLDDIIKEAENNFKEPSEIHIISVTDEFEQGMPNMLQPHELEALEKAQREEGKRKEGKSITFKHHQVPMTDFGADITPQSVLAAVYKMRQIIESGGMVYIHCKAGRARSAMIVATYLAIFEKGIEAKQNPLKVAVEKLMKKRPQVNLHIEGVSDWDKLMETSGVKKLQKAQEAINLHRAIEEELQAEDKNKSTDLKTINYIERFNQFSIDKNWQDLSWEKPIPKKESFLTSLKNIMSEETKTWKFNEGDSLLSTLEFKNDLANSTAFKQLKIEIMKSVNPLKNINKKYLKELNKKIYEASDDSWYTEFKEGKGPLWKLYENTKMTDNLRTTIHSFIGEIKKIYEPDKIKELTEEEIAKATKSVSIKQPVKDGHTTEIFKKLANYDRTQATKLISDAVHAHERDKEHRQDQRLSREAVIAHDREMIKKGWAFAKLIFDAQKISGIPLDKIQFNFCIDSLPSNKETIQRAIEMYVNHQLNDDDVSKDEKDELYRWTHPFTIKLPNNSASLHSYDEALSLRAKSFCNAAKMIIDHSELADKSSSKAKLQNLYDTFDKNIHETYLKREQQAYYDAYIKALKAVLADALKLSNKEISQYLKNAETICNMKEKDAQITISGKFDVTSRLPDVDISLQIEEPLTQFKYLSEEQKKAWIEAIQAYQQDKKASKPTWFAEMPEFEKEIWVKRLIDSNGKADIDAFMVPVVKKQGIPGLRNLSLSTFATIKYNEKLPEQIFVSEKSIRSSNLIGQKKEGTAKLSEEEKQITKMNIEQINHVYKEKKIEKEFMDLWGVDKDRPKHVLCQTLVRKFGGGDDYVIGHKSKALAEVKKSSLKSSDNLTYHQSNHCLSPGNIIFQGVMEVLGTNISSMDHVIEPVDNFMKVAFYPNFRKAMPDKEIEVDPNFRKPISDEDMDIGTRIINGKINPLYEHAVQGKLTASEIDATFKTGYLQYYLKNKDPEIAMKHDLQLNTIKRVLLALSMYTQINNKPTSFKKHNQLHLAALEEIIYEDTGNRMQSSCKSGKDRQGVEKDYRNAMYKFFEEKGYLPPAKRSVNPDDRKDFIKIFIDLFKTNHQARLAELNADGCQGLKALKNILPKDIMRELKREFGQELDKHKDNASLNVLGLSNVVRDNTTYKHAQAIYADIISDNRKESTLVKTPH